MTLAESDVSAKGKSAHTFWQDIVQLSVKNCKIERSSKQGFFEEMRASEKLGGGLGGLTTSNIRI